MNAGLDTAPDAARMSINRFGCAAALLMLLGAGCTSNTTMTPQTPPAQDRILLSSMGGSGENLEDHYPHQRRGTEREECLAKFNSDPSNETAAFSDPGAGFSVDVPYNAAWGNDQYRIAPYELALEDDRFYYGPLQVYSGDRTCTWERNIIYLFQPRTAEAEMKDLRGEAGNVDRELKSVDVRKIGDMQVVDATYAPIAGMTCHVLRVIGKKHNYAFHACGDLAPLERMIGTMKLLD